MTAALSPAVTERYGRGWWDCDPGGVVEDVADCAGGDISWDDPLAALGQVLGAAADCAGAAVDAVAEAASECGRPDDEHPFTFNNSDIGASPEDGDRFGFSLAVGDFDCDNADDLAIGAPFEDYGNVTDAGVVSVRYFTGANTGWETFWMALAVGDMDNDGDLDLLIGMPGREVAGSEAAGETHQVSRCLLVAGA